MQAIVKACEPLAFAYLAILQLVKTTGLDSVARLLCHLGLVINSDETPKMLDEKIAGVPFNWL
jgi:hypothetical protein